VGELKFGIGDALGTDSFFLKGQMTPRQLDYLRRTRELVDHDFHASGTWPWAPAAVPMNRPPASACVIRRGFRARLHREVLRRELRRHYGKAGSSG
jgi:hypothetical protein